MNTSEIPPLLNRDEFAELMLVNPRTIDTWIARKKFSDDSRVKIRGRNYFRTEQALADLGLTWQEWHAVRDKQKK